MTIRGHLLVALLFACASFSPGTAWANVSIPVNNPSFETLPSGGLNLVTNSYGAYNYGSIPDWMLITGNAGEWAPTGGIFTDPIPNGSNVAFSNGGTISQTVAATVNTGVTYTLSVYVGSRLDGYSGGYTDAVELLIGGTPYYATGSEPNPGDWSLWTATYTGTGTDAGKSITIELNPSPSEPQSDFDKVSLSATPEPGFYGALALGMSGLLLAIQRRRRA
jgi:hypothetical protein